MNQWSCILFTSNLVYLLLHVPFSAGQSCIQAYDKEVFCFNGSPTTPVSLTCPVNFIVKVRQAMIYRSRFPDQCNPDAPPATVCAMTDTTNALMTSLLNTCAQQQSCTVISRVPDNTYCTAATGPVFAEVYYRCEPLQNVNMSARALAIDSNTGFSGYLANIDSTPLALLGKYITNTKGTCWLTVPAGVEFYIAPTIFMKSNMTSCSTYILVSSLGSLVPDTKLCTMNMPAVQYQCQSTTQMYTINYVTTDITIPVIFVLQVFVKYTASFSIYCGDQLPTTQAVTTSAVTTTVTTQTTTTPAITTPTITTTTTPTTTTPTTTTPTTTTPTTTTPTTMPTTTTPTTTTPTTTTSTTTTPTTTTPTTPAVTTTTTTTTTTLPIFANITTTSFRTVDATTTSQLSLGAIIGIIAALCALLIILALCCAFYCQRKQKRKEKRNVITTNAPKQPNIIVVDTRRDVYYDDQGKQAKGSLYGSSAASLSDDIITGRNSYGWTPPTHRVADDTALLNRHSSGSHVSAAGLSSLPAYHSSMLEMRPMAYENYPINIEQAGISGGRLIRPASNPSFLTSNYNSPQIIAPPPQGYLTTGINNNGFVAEQPPSLNIMQRSYVSTTPTPKYSSIIQLT